MNMAVDDVRRQVFAEWRAERDRKDHLSDWEPQHMSPPDRVSAPVDDGCPPPLPDEAYAGEFTKAEPITCPDCQHEMIPGKPCVACGWEQGEQASSGRTSTFYSAASLKGKPVPERQWLVPGMVPQKTVTLFSGDGGTGKSLLALQLAVAVVAGTGWIGKSVQQGPALLISAEDDDDELHRRLDDILRTEGRDYDDVAGLTLRSLAGEDALLAVDSQIALMETTLFKELESRAAHDMPALIVIDTLADVYPANENDRAKVRQFVGILRGLALRQRCAVMLLGHPSLTSLNSGSGTSGSTAWNNGVRSRLYLSRVMDETKTYEPDTRKRVLSIKKQNYGETGAEIGMTWQEGVFVPDAMETSLDRMAGAAKAERVFLKLLRIFSDQGRRVNHAGDTTYAPKLFSEHPDCEGLTKRAFKTAMEGLLASGKVRIETEGPASRRVSYLAEGEQ